MIFVTHPAEKRQNFFGVFLQFQFGVDTQAEVEEYQSIGYKMTWAKWWKFFHSIEDNGGDFTLDALKTFSQEELLINTGDLPGGAYVGGNNGGDSISDEQKMSSQKDVVNGQVSDHPSSVADSEG